MLEALNVADELAKAEAEIDRLVQQQQAQQQLQLAAPPVPQAPPAAAAVIARDLTRESAALLANLRGATIHFLVPAQPSLMDDAAARNIRSARSLHINRVKDLENARAMVHRRATAAAIASPANRQHIERIIDKASSMLVETERLSRRAERLFTGAQSLLRNANGVPLPNHLIQPLYDSFKMANDSAVVHRKEVEKASRRLH